MRRDSEAIRRMGAVGALALVLALVVGQVSPSGLHDVETNSLAEAAEIDGSRFEWVDVYLDSGDAPLAAYQLELTAESGTFQIVGVEGGEHAAFVEPPYYDPAALQHDRVILAAFSTGDDLPTGSTRVARVHVMIEGERPSYVATLTVAATADGGSIPVEIQLEEGARP